MGIPKDIEDKGDAALDWLGKVSEAATALSGTCVPNQFERGAGRFNVSRAPVGIAKSIALSANRADSLDPLALETFSRQFRRRRALITVIACVFATGLTGTLIMRESTVSDLQQLLHLPPMPGRAVLSDSSAAATHALRPGPPPPRLTVQLMRGSAGEPVPLGLEVQGELVGAVVKIRGLVPGMDVSAGSSVGPDIWQIAATDLGYAWIAPPGGFAGTADLVGELYLSNGELADRQHIRIEWVTTVSAAAPDETRQSDQSEPRRLAETAQLSIAQVHEMSSASNTLLQDVPAQIAEAQLPVSAMQLQFDHKPVEETSALPTVSDRLGEQHVTPETLRVPETAQVELAKKEEHASRWFPAVRSERRGSDQRRGAISPTLVLWRFQGHASQKSTILAQQPFDEGNSGTDSPQPRASGQLDKAEISMLVGRGRDLFAQGDLAAARVVLRRAADAHNAEAALMLGATYDPFVLRELKAHRLVGDVEAARAWYEKARALGSDVAVRRLEMLANRVLQ
jgi:hypothetical protein